MYFTNLFSTTSYFARDFKSFFVNERQVSSQVSLGMIIGRIIGCQEANLPIPYELKFTSMLPLND
jgi:hypothetical protein